VTEKQPVLELSRPFEWGIVLLCDDRATNDWPSLERGAAFAASRSALEIVVRHAQDTDADLSSLDPSDPVPPFNVLVRCWVGTDPSSHASIESILTMSSCRMVIGDAERWDAIDLAPGEWTVCVATAPADHAEEVSIWLNRVEPEA
jgi:hypothetical protein